MILVEEGRQTLSDPVSRWLPSFAQPTVAVRSDTGVILARANRRISIKDLLTHTAGISYGTDSLIAARYQAAGLGPAAGYGWYTAEQDLIVSPGTRRRARRDNRRPDTQARDTSPHGAEEPTTIRLRDALSWTEPVEAGRTTGRRWPFKHFGDGQVLFRREPTMNLPRSVILAISVVLSFIGTIARAQDGTDAEWRRQRDRLIERLDAARATVASFGTGWTSLYEIALPWYAKWGGRDNKPVSRERMTDPEAYLEELARALEAGRNFFAEQVGASIPCWFEVTRDGDRQFTADYQLSLPAGFPVPGRTFPLVIRLGGSGDVGQKISFMRGDGPAGPVFSIKPISQRGAWQIDFLNAFVDDLMKRLPVDPDRVYLEGHSLGAIATWQWALENPERFAAIAPRAGWGEPYRASRLANVPAWAIHGEGDETVAPVVAELMISALRDRGGEARYSLLKGVQHNIPNQSPGFDYQDVLRWYLSHTRSREPVPADPRDALGIGADGVSPVEAIVVPGGRYWSTPPLERTVNWLRSQRDFKGLYQPLRQDGSLASGPVRQRVLDPPSREGAYLLEIPAKVGAAAETAGVEVVRVPERKVARFYIGGTSTNEDAQVAAVRGSLARDGIATTGEMWITTLSARSFSSQPITEYWLIIK